ncbi:hypothetical protein ADK58_12315, partial [Streptomyces sp. XY152]
MPGRAAPGLKAPSPPWPREASDGARGKAIPPPAQPRLKVLSEITDNVDFLFLPEPVLDEASWNKAMK